jgi:hypothetical protein
MGGGFDPRLGRAFDFGAADLDANRRGELSSDQRVMFSNAVRIGARRERRVLPILLALAVATVVVAVIGAGALDDPGAALPAIVVVVVMLTFLTALVLIFRRRDAAARTTMVAGQIETVEGPWELDTSLDGTWRIRVGGRLVGADRLAVDTLADDGIYRFHVLPLRGVAAVLSVERVG